MSYDDSYRRTPALFGEEPEAILLAFLDLLDRRLPALDLGCGQGRNALALARRGYAVVGLEPSGVAAAELSRVAAEEGLDLSVRVEGFAGFEPQREVGFGAVLVFGLLQLLTWPELELLVAALERWTAPGGLAFLTAFTTADPGWAERRAAPERFRPIGPRSTRDELGEVRTYLEPGELAELFGPPAWEQLHLWEGEGPEHRHGDGPLERHGLVQGVFRRR